ncbi:hypothetical protein Hanom_Chr05g00407931 [Helianthus anomalus]
MSPRVRTQHGEITAELAWSGSGSRNKITPVVGRTVHYPPKRLHVQNYSNMIIKVYHTNKNSCFSLFLQ